MYALLCVHIFSISFKSIPINFFLYENETAAIQFSCLQCTLLKVFTSYHFSYSNNTTQNSELRCCTLFEKMKPNQEMNSKKTSLQQCTTFSHCSIFSLNRTLVSYRIARLKHTPRTNYNKNNHKFYVKLREMEKNTQIWEG